MSCAAIWNATASTSSIARDGNEALRLLGTQRIDVAVLDVMMPGPDGLTLCRSLRQRGDYTVPVILLTALGEEDDRIAGLEAGADDYLDQAVQPARTGAAGALGAATGAVDRRGAAAGADRRRSDRLHRLTLGDVKGEPVSLTNREFDLLLFFMTHADTVFSRDGAAQAGVAVGLRRPVDGHGARQAVAVQARRPAPGADGVGPRLPVE